LLRATEAQRADYLARFERHADELTHQLQAGAIDESVIHMARQFYQECISMPRKPPTPPTPEEQVALVAKAICNPSGQCRPAFTAAEVDAIVELLRRQPGAKLGPVTSTGVQIGDAIVPRRALRDACLPGSATRTDGWYRQFPSPDEYEGPAMVPPRDEWPTVTPDPKKEIALDAVNNPRWQPQQSTTIRRVSGLRGGPK
jgi:hypothetical protein